LSSLSFYITHFWTDSTLTPSADPGWFHFKHETQSCTTETSSSVDGSVLEQMATRVSSNNYNSSKMASTWSTYQGQWLGDVVRFKRNTWNVVTGSNYENI